MPRETAATKNARAQAALDERVRHWTETPNFYGQRLTPVQVRSAVIEEFNNGYSWKLRDAGIDRDRYIKLAFALPSAFSWKELHVAKCNGARSPRGPRRQSVRNPSPEAPPPVKTRTVRVIWKCKCGLVKAYDYTATRRFQYVDRVYGTPHYGPAKLTRVVEGVMRDVSWDAKCPACGRDRKSAEVTGVRTEHECDARCMASTSGKCECSCGGRNHGASHL